MIIVHELCFSFGIVGSGEILHGHRAVKNVRQGCGFPQVNLGFINTHLQMANCDAKAGKSTVINLITIMYKYNLA